MVSTLLSTRGGSRKMFVVTQLVIIKVGVRKFDLFACEFAYVFTRNKH